MAGICQEEQFSGWLVFQHLDQGFRCFNVDSEVLRKSLSAPISRSAFDLCGDYPIKVTGTNHHRGHLYLLAVTAASVYRAALP